MQTDVLLETWVLIHPGHLKQSHQQRDSVVCVCAHVCACTCVCAHAGAGEGPICMPSLFTQPQSPNLL